MRVIARCAALALFVAGCSTPLAPPAKESASSQRLLRLPERTVEARFVGSTVRLDRNFQPKLQRHVVFEVHEWHEGQPITDTVATGSSLEQVKWPILSAQHLPRLSPDEPVGSPSESAKDTGQVFAPGTHILTLQAPDHAGGGTATIAFVVDFAPDPWWAGPDPSQWPASPDGDGRSVAVTDWTHFTTTPAWPPDGRGYFGPDSFSFIPSVRRPPGDDFDRRTFYEIYGDRIYARSEGDAVHQGAWIVFVNGGYDKDSEYRPLVDPSDPALPPDFSSNPAAYPVLQDLGLVGSPIGFRAGASIKRADGSRVVQAFSSTYPNFDPLSVFRLPQVMGYWRADLPGKVYLVTRAVDSDGSVSTSPASPIDLADLVDSGGGTPEQRLERRKILTFQVRPAPTRPF